MENSPATGQDEGREGREGRPRGVGGQGPLGAGRAIDGRWLGKLMPGFLPRLLSRGVWVERGSFESYSPPPPPLPRLGRGHWAPAQAVAFLLPGIRH